jgi:EAL domain-containing protein (putative c-di-GMP-specific phosphodiesterase class I)
MRLIVRMDNYQAVLRAFGEPVAAALILHLCARLKRTFPQASLASPRDGHVAMEFPGDEIGRPELAHQARLLCAAVTLAGVDHDGRTIHPVLSMQLADDDLIQPQSGEVIAGPTFISGEETAEQYRRDMSDAARLFAAIRDKRLFLARQAVGCPEDGSILYSETLSRILAEDGNLCSCGSLIAAAERVGLAPAFDRFVMARVLNELKAAPLARLGVNLSAASAVCDFAWEPLLTAIEKNRSLATRLVVEITESSPVWSIGLAVGFVDRLRQAGCWVAVDDFGTGHSSIRRLLSLKPDVVKVDALFLKLAASQPERSDILVRHPAPCYRELLRNLVGIAESLAPVTVIEGVETAAHADIARAIGARWMQGYHIGCPSFARGRQPAVRLPNLGPSHDFATAHHVSPSLGIGA